MKGPKNKYHQQRGFSLIEILMVVFILGFVILVGFSQIRQMAGFSKKVSDRLNDDFIFGVSAKQVAADLEGSYFSRLDFFNCDSSKNVLQSKTPAEFQISTSTPTFELIKVDFASIVGLAGATQTVVVADARRLKVGDYVLLSLASKLTESGLFKVSTVDPVSNYVGLGTTTFDEAGSECRDSLSPKTVSSFFGPTVRSNVILSRISASRYSLEKGDLRRATFPGNPSGEVIVQNVKDLLIKSEWMASTGDATTSQQYGQMKFKVSVNVDDKSLVANDSKINNTKVINSGYSLTPYQLSNDYSEVGAPSVAISFPTCGVNTEFKQGALRIDPMSDLYRDSSTIKLTGNISGIASTPVINVNFLPNPGAMIQCFLNDPENGVYPSFPNMLSGPGIGSMVSLAQSVAGFDIYTCAVRGTVELSASMSYFDSTLNQVKTINCSSESIQAPSGYKFTSADLPSCSRGKWIDSSWHVGSKMVGLNDQVNIGNFSIDYTNSCVWDGQTGSVATGVGFGCGYFSRPSRSAKLKQLYLRPYKISVFQADGKTPFSKTEGAYIDCK